MTVFEKIAAQQQGKENTAVWMVGQQLKDICRADPACAELVDKDIDSKGMSIVEAEKKVKEWADKNKKKSADSSCVPPDVAEQIIRKFYGLPEADAAPEPGKASSDILDLSDILS